MTSLVLAETSGWEIFATLLVLSLLAAPFRKKAFRSRRHRNYPMEVAGMILWIVIVAVCAAHCDQIRGRECGTMNRRMIAGAGKARPRKP
ncbi:MAG: hypothetical protein HY720_24930 [Planctomycetes bacterium]|nr:hypothetical protein [Planctomycetota bacterium]